MTWRIYFTFHCKNNVLLTNKTRLVLAEVNTAVLCDSHVEQANKLCKQNAETCLILKERGSDV